MKKIITLMLLLFTLNSQASILLRLFLSGSDSRIESPQKTELEIILREINQKLPSKCFFGPTSYCWEQYKESTREFNIPSKLSESILSYYRIKKYQVSFQDDKLYFDFSQEHKSYLRYKQEPVRIEVIILIIMFAGLISLGMWFKSMHLKRVLAIKEVYEKDFGKDLIFFEKANLSVLEKHLSKNTLPAGWNFHIKEGRIVSISSYEGGALSKIATSSQSLKDSLQSIRLPSLRDRF